MKKIVYEGAIVIHTKEGSRQFICLFIHLFILFTITHAIVYKLSEI